MMNEIMCLCVYVFKLFVLSCVFEMMMILMTNIWIYPVFTLPSFIFIMYKWVNGWTGEVRNAGKVFHEKKKKKKKGGGLRLYVDTGDTWYFTVSNNLFIRKYLTSPSLSFSISL